MALAVVLFLVCVCFSVGLVVVFEALRNGLKKRLDRK